MQRSKPPLELALFRGNKMGLQVQMDLITFIKIDDKCFKIRWHFIRFFVGSINLMQWSLIFNAIQNVNKGINLDNKRIYTLNLSFIFVKKD